MSKQISKYQICKQTFLQLNCFAFDEPYQVCSLSRILRCSQNIDFSLSSKFLSGYGGRRPKQKKWKSAKRNTAWNNLMKKQLKFLCLVFYSASLLTFDDAAHCRERESLSHAAMRPIAKLLYLKNGTSNKSRHHGPVLKVNCGRDCERRLASPDFL